MWCAADESKTVMVRSMRPRCVDAYGFGGEARSVYSPIVTDDPDGCPLRTGHRTGLVAHFPDDLDDAIHILRGGAMFHHY